MFASSSWLLLVALWVVADSYFLGHQKILTKRSITKDTDTNAWSLDCGWKERVKWLVSCVIGATMMPEMSYGIGAMNELKDRPMVLQDVIFNINNVDQEIKLFQETFQDTCVLLHSEVNQKENYVSSTIGFGPDTYKRVKSFIPGISSFSENGAHATITFHSPVGISNDADVKVLYGKGNGLQHIKIGTELLRLSKSLAYGANIKYAYGWVDLDTANEIPVQIVVGVASDPLMSATLKVSNLQQSKEFFVDKLGMKILPFPLARSPGSEFEQPAPLGSVYVSYGADTMGLLLVEQSKGSSPVQVGSQLEAFKIVVDDKIDENMLPEVTRSMFQGSKMKSAIVESPDGYRFLLQPYSEFERTARTTSIRTR